MKTLVIKSASMEQLASLASALDLGARAPGEVEVLAHPHLAETIRRSFPAVTVVEYPFAGNFSSWGFRRMVWQKKLSRRYDRVILLVSNVRGGGHFNVMRAALRFGAAPELFNVNGQFLAYNRRIVNRMLANRILLWVPVFFATIGALVAGGLVLAGCAIAAAFKGRE